MSSALDDGVVGKVMDFPSVASGGDNGSEGIAVDLFSSGNFGENDPLHRSLAQAWLNLREDGVEDEFVELLRSGEELDFGGGLESASALDGGTGRETFG